MGWKSFPTAVQGSRLMEVFLSLLSFVHRPTGPTLPVFWTLLYFVVLLIPNNDSSNWVLLLFHVYRTNTKSVPIVLHLIYSPFLSYPVSCCFRLYRNSGNEKGESPEKESSRPSTTMSPAQQAHWIVSYGNYFSPTVVSLFLQLDSPWLLHQDTTGNNTFWKIAGCQC